MLTVDALKEYGADVEDGMERCLNDADFYLSLIGPALEEKDYRALEETLQKKDFANAFEIAHGLKGVLGNLALTPLYQPVSEMTELLRKGEDTDYGPYLQTMWEQRKKLLELL